MRISDWSADVCSSDLLLLAELIERHTPDGEAPIRGAAAFQLADGLARVIDQLHYEEVRPAALVDLDLGAFASHWQASLGRLRLLVDHWPGVLARTGSIDRAERRGRLDRKSTRLNSRH